MHQYQNEICISFYLKDIASVRFTREVLLLPFFKWLIFFYLSGISDIVDRPNRCASATHSLSILSGFLTMLDMCRSHCLFDDWRGAVTQPSQSYFYHHSHPSDLKVTYPRTAYLPPPDLSVLHHRTALCIEFNPCFVTDSLILSCLKRKIKIKRVLSGYIARAQFYISC